MTAKNPIPTFLAKAVRTKKLLYILAIVTILGLAGWAKNALAATVAADAATSAITPALQLAVGTVNLENTAQAVDASSAAKLLPLWQLLAQLQDSGIAAPEEFTAVIDEIKLNMTPAQVRAIDAMKISDAGLAGASAAASGAQAASIGGAPGALDMFAGGGPTRPGNSQSTSSTKTSASSSAAASAIQEVIQLLQKKLQN